MRISLWTMLSAAPLLFLGASCASVQSGSVTGEATADDYAKSRSTKGVVVLAINWGRRWGCGAYENAEIMNIGFDRLPLKDASNNSPSEIFLEGPPRLTRTPAFVDYALLLEPGEYALSSFDISAARSISDVGHFVAKRSNLIQNGENRGGSFQVNAGETVYIGHFFLDCHQNPTLWRYYPEGRDGFRKYMDHVKQKYPFVEPNEVAFRLFRTTTLGNEYELPK